MARQRYDVHHNRIWKLHFHTDGQSFKVWITTASSTQHRHTSDEWDHGLSITGHGGGVKHNLSLGN